VNDLQASQKASTGRDRCAPAEEVMKQSKPGIAINVAGDEHTESIRTYVFIWDPDSRSTRKVTGLPFAFKRDSITRANQLDR
jgi:hypothetical protein